MSTNLITKSLSRKWYTDKKIYDKETDRIFFNSWLLICSESKIAKPGETLFIEIMNQPLIFIRQKDHSIKVFYNICSHRGGSIKEENRCVSYLQCTYHGWIYNLNGELKKTRGFNSSQLNFNDLKLKEIYSRVWKGLLFINFSSTTDIFEKTFNKIEKVISPYNIDNFIFYKRISYDIKCNWKVYLDNYLEGLHIPIVHPKLNQVLNYKSYKTEIFNNFSVQSGKIANQNSPYLSNSNSCAYYVAIYPNFLFNLAPGRLQTNIIEPVNEKECIVHFDYYFDSIEKSIINEDITFSDKVQKEDIFICEKIQKNLSSRGFDKGILSGDHELGVKHFQAFVRKSLK
tara:strand:- start:1354 stop:2382 length:1029 start_codon:yes stop_codon:yes gene_type:complete